VLALTVIFLNLTHEHIIGKHASKLLIIIAVITAVTTSLYKYDISRFNSIIGEQLIVVSCLLIFFWIGCRRTMKRSVWAFLLRPQSMSQAALKGVALVMKSVAYSMGPGSVIAIIGTSFSLLWTVVFGRVYFRERHVIHKALACLLAVVALIFIYYRS